MNLKFFGLSSLEDVQVVVSVVSTLLASPMMPISSQFTDLSALFNSFFGGQAIVVCAAKRVRRVVGKWFSVDNTQSQQQRFASCSIDLGKIQTQAADISRPARLWLDISAAP